MSRELHPLFTDMEKLIQEQNDLKFNEFCEKNKDFLLKENPLAFIQFQVDYYALKDDFFKTLEVVNYYKNAPYISMEVEDFLNELKAKLETYQEPKEKQYSLEDIQKALQSNNENTIAAALTYLDKQNIRMYLPVVEKFLESDKVLYKYKTLALFILIQQKVEQEVKVFKDGLIYTIAPSILELPLDTYEYELCKKEIQKSKVPSNVIQLAIEIMNTVQIKEFPDSYIDLENYKYMKDVFIYMGEEYLNVDGNSKFTKSISQIAKDHEMNLEAVEQTISTLNSVMVK